MTTHRDCPMSRETQTLGEEMSACLLQQSRFCVFGVIAGLPFSVRARSYWPFISLGIAGMGADLLWGLLAPKEFYGCREVCEAYRKHVRGPTSPPSSPPKTPGR